MIIGGIRRIGRVTSILAPSMALLYVAGALIILLLNIDGIPAAFGLIVHQAFAPEPLIGGGVGSFMMTLMWGIRRGLFSNEAGQGSAPIAHATAKTKEPVREGLVASLGPVHRHAGHLHHDRAGDHGHGGLQGQDRAESRPGRGRGVLAASATMTRAGWARLRRDRESGGGSTVEVVEGQLVGASTFFHASVRRASAIHRHRRAVRGAGDSTSTPGRHG